MTQKSQFKNFGWISSFSWTCPYIHFKPPQEYNATCARVRPSADQNDKFRAIFISGCMITQVQHSKFLGVVIEEKLSWDYHISYLIKKLWSFFILHSGHSSFITNTFLFVAAQLWNSVQKRIVKSDCGLETSVSLVSCAGCPVFARSEPRGALCTCSRGSVQHALALSS